MNEAFAVDLQFAFSIDIPNINILQRRGLSVPGQECTDTICIGSTVHTNEWCKVYNCMLLCIMKYINSYHSARALQSQSKTEITSGSKQLAKVITQSSHLTGSLRIFLFFPSSLVSHIHHQ